MNTEFSSSSSSEYVQFLSIADPEHEKTHMEWFLPLSLHQPPKMWEYQLFPHLMTPVAESPTLLLWRLTVWCDNKLLYKTWICPDSEAQGTVVTWNKREGKRPSGCGGTRIYLEGSANYPRGLIQVDRLRVLQRKQGSFIPIETAHRPCSHTPTRRCVPGPIVSLTNRNNPWSGVIIFDQWE